MSAGEVRRIPFSLIDLDPDNYRRTYQGIRELAETIREDGLLQNLVVKEKPDGRYEVKAGNRRWKALTLLGYKNEEVLCLVKPNTGTIGFESLIENEARHEVPPWESGHRFLEYMEATGYTQRELANRIGTNVNRVSQCVMIAKGLSPKIVSQLQRIGVRTLAMPKLLRLARFVDPETGEPRHDKQLKLFDVMLVGREGQQKRRKLPAGVKDRVFERYQKLRVMGVKDPMGAFWIEKVLRYLEEGTAL